MEGSVFTVTVDEVIKLLLNLEQLCSYATLLVPLIVLSEFGIFVKETIVFW